jgi:hypothetical protein
MEGSVHYYFKHGQAVLQITVWLRMEGTDAYLISLEYLGLEP